MMAATMVIRDGASVHAFEGRYGDYVLAKVRKVFPQLREQVLRACRAHANSRGNRAEIATCAARRLQSRRSGIRRRIDIQSIENHGNC
jgi:hypothetical protein